MTPNKQEEFEILPGTTEAFHPSASQSEAIDLFDTFVVTPDTQVMILTGAAGTGKTEVISEFCRRLRSQGRLTVLLAPTGQAARRLAKRTGFSAQTIHSRVFGNPAMNEMGDDRPPQSIFSIQHEMMPPREAVYIIDESSFISNEPMDERTRERAEMVFGTTNLLADILTHVASRKVVFVGDTSQLPPIGLDSAPALEPETFEQLGVGVVAHRLTEVLRRDEQSPISMVGWVLAESIEHAQSEANLEVRHQPEAGMELLDTPTLETDELSAFLSGSAAVVARSHVGVAHWNHLIRRGLGRKIDVPTPGDKLLLAKASFHPRIENGEQLEVLDIGDEINVIRETIREDSGSREVEVRLVHGLFQLDGASEPSDTFTSFLALDGCYSLDSDRMSAIRRVLWIDFLKRASRRGITRKDGSVFWDLFFTDPRAQSLLATYAYARTVHKSQGGEWDWVVADLSAVRGRSPINQRMTYTAVTRARARLSIYFWPFAVRYIDLDEIGQAVVDRLSFSAGIVSEICPVQSGRQIRSESADLIINIYERSGRLGAITVQKCPIDMRNTIERLLREVELSVRTRLQPLIEPALLVRVERLEAILVEQGYEFFAWRHADYQVAIVVRLDSKEAGEIHHHNSAGDLVRLQRVTDGSDTRLGAVLRSAAERSWR